MNEATPRGISGIRHVEPGNKQTSPKVNTEKNGSSGRMIRRGQHVDGVFGIMFAESGRRNDMI